MGRQINCKGLTFVIKWFKVHFISKNMKTLIYYLAIFTIIVSVAFIVFSIILFASEDMPKSGFMYIMLGEFTIVGCVIVEMLKTIQK